MHAGASSTLVLESAVPSARRCGCSGSYLMRDCHGTIIAIYTPKDEEPYSEARVPSERLSHPAVSVMDGIAAATYSVPSIIHVRPSLYDLLIAQSNTIDRSHPRRSHPTSPPLSRPGPVFSAQPQVHYTTHALPRSPQLRRHERPLTLRHTRSSARPHSLAHTRTHACTRHAKH